MMYYKIVADQRKYVWRTVVTRPDRSFELPRHLSEALSMSEAVLRFERMFMPSFQVATARFGIYPELGDWIDMKIDPVTGEDREARDGRGDLYARNRVYGWIQGRGLEAMSMWLRWNDSTPAGRPAPAGAEDGVVAQVERESVARTAESLYRKIVECCFPGKDGQLRGGFVMTPQGCDLRNTPSGAPDGQEGTTLTALFLLRGLLAYASFTRSKADAGWIVLALRNAVDAALRGECLNDQLSFGALGGGERGVRPRGSGDSRVQGYEGRMIALGACRLLFEHTREAADRDRGARLVGSVLEQHLFRNSDGQAWLSDVRSPVGSDPRAARTADSAAPVGVNPGHIIEFAGLALQFHRIAGGIPAEQRGLLVELALTSWQIGLAPCGGIVRGMDGRNGSILDPHCPWWSSFEAVRTFTEVFFVTEDAKLRGRCLETIGRSLDCIDSVYLGPSNIGIPVQTVSPEGKVVDFIPATPDIDPGYHTGIPLMDADLALRTIRTMSAGAAEAAVPPRLGVLLQGHLARSQAADSEMDPLHVRTCVMEAQGSSVAFVSADVLEYSHEWAEDICRKLSSLSGIPEDRIFLTATHTHTAPAAIGLGTRAEDAVFQDALRTAMLTTMKTALRNMQPVVGLSGSIELENLGINRRYLNPETGSVSMRPNPAGDRDREIGCLFLVGRDAAPTALLLNLAVHPTTLGVGIHAISADYPGRAAAALTRHYGEQLVVLPIQGACGDVRPALLDSSGKSFVDGNADDIERMGQAIADSIVERVHAACPADVPSGGFSWLDFKALHSTSKLVALPYFTIKSKNKLIEFRKRMQDLLAVSALAGRESRTGFAATHDNPALGADALAAWADSMISTSSDMEGRYTGPTSETARFGFCELEAREGRSLQFFSLPGEAFSRIGLALKAAAAPSRLFVCGYCGGSVGYIPTADAFTQGGYEVEQAYMYYGRPAALSPSTESLIPALYRELRKEAH
jgi:hypothetical protein